MTGPLLEKWALIKSCQKDGWSNCPSSDIWKNPEFFPFPSTVSYGLLFIYLLAFLSNSGHFPLSSFYCCSNHASPNTLFHLPAVRLVVRSDLHNSNTVAFLSLSALFASSGSCWDLQLAALGFSFFFFLVFFYLITLTTTITTVVVWM